MLNINIISFKCKTHLQREKVIVLTTNHKKTIYHIAFSSGLRFFNRPQRYVTELLLAVKRGLYLNQVKNYQISKNTEVKFWNFDRMIDLEKKPPSFRTYSFEQLHLVSRFSSRAFKHKEY